MTIVVTAEASDAEMAERIERHQLERPAGWTTVEAHRDLAGAVAAVPPDRCIVVDCLTLWLTNLLLDGQPVEAIEQAIDLAVTALKKRQADVIVVSNEVGLGIVPGDALSRSFRDIQGRCNQRFASQFDRALFVAAGNVLPLVAPETAFEELN